MVAAESLKGVQIDFKGGLVGMTVKKRDREGLPYPSTELWRFPDFKDGVVRMLEVQPPKVPEKIIRDLGDGVCPPPSMDIVTGGDDGHTRATPPASEGASCGGPSAPIDADMADAQKRLMIAEMNAKTVAMELQAARDAKDLAAIRESGGGPGGAAAGSGTGPAVTGNCLEPAGKGDAEPGTGGDKKVSAIESIDIEANKRVT